MLYRLYCIDCAVSIVLYRHYWPDYHDSLVQFPGSVPERVGPSELVDGALHTQQHIHTSMTCAVSTQPVIVCTLSGVHSGG